MLKKIAFCGLDDNKRSTLAAYVAHHLQAYCVPNYKKEYIKMVDRNLLAVDYKKIAKGMLNLEREYANISKDYLIYDNNIVQLYVEAEMKFNTEITWAEKRVVMQKFDVFIITDTVQNDFTKRFQHNISNDKIIFNHNLTKEDLLRIIRKKAPL